MVKVLIKPHVSDNEDRLLLNQPSVKKINT